MTSQPTPTKSSRKRKAPIDDNGEPVKLDKKRQRGIPKEKNATHSSATGKAATVRSVVPKKPIPVKKPVGKNRTQQVLQHPVARRSPSVEIEDVPDEDDHPQSFPPRNPRYILESVDSSDNEDETQPSLTRNVNMDDEEARETSPEDGARDASPEDEEAELG